MLRPCVTTELSNMKYTIVILLFLVAMSQAQKDDEYMLGVVKNFVEGARDIPVPITLARGVFTQELVEAIVNSVETMLTNLILEYYQQAFRAKDSMIRDMKSATERLIEPLPDVSNMEDSLIRVNQLLEKLLSCIPGNVMIKRRGLPDLPVVKENVTVHHGNENLPSIFLDLAALIDRDLVSIYSLINEIYLAGWQKARLNALNKLQDLFRNDFLNNILRSFACEIRKIDRNEKYINNYVKRVTWNNYKMLSERINLAQQSLEN